MHTTPSSRDPEGPPAGTNLYGGRVNHNETLVSIVRHAVSYNHNETLVRAGT